MFTELEQLLNEKSSLLPVVSARLRMALSDIYGGMERIAPLKERVHDQELDKGAAYLEKGYYQLLRLAGNLSSADRFVNETPLALYDCDIAALCRDICRRAKPLLAEKRVRLRFSAVPRRIVTAVDSAAIERVLLNLLCNSAKAIPENGSISVTLRLSDDKQTVLLSVLDNGTGIDPDVRDTLFELQLTLAAAFDPNAGLGLGLALSRDIVEGHGGSIVLSDAPNGKGTQAVVSLPMRRQTEPRMNDRHFDYMGGFDHVLVELSAALPASAFQRYEPDELNAAEDDLK